MEQSRPLNQYILVSISSSWMMGQWHTIRLLQKHISQQNTFSWKIRELVTVEGKYAAEFSLPCAISLYIYKKQTVWLLLLLLLLLFISWKSCMNVFFTIKVNLHEALFLIAYMGKNTYKCVYLWVHSIPISYVWMMRHNLPGYTCNLPGWIYSVHPKQLPI